MRVLAPNKVELWVSIGLVAIGVLAFRTRLPLGPVDTIGFAVVVLFAWFLALNAGLDIRRMNWPSRVLAVVWFVFVTGLAIHVLGVEFTFDRRWADR